jgi:hypothetical protein
MMFDSFLLDFVKIRIETLICLSFIAEICEICINISSKKYHWLQHGFRIHQYYRHYLP